jgi:hypothetical protein
VLVPQHAAAVAESLCDARLGARHGLNHIEAAANIKGTVLVRQSQRLLRRKPKAPALLIILDVTAGGLIYQPFTNVSRDRAGALGQLFRGRRPAFRQPLIKAKLLTHITEHGAQPGAKIADDFAQKFL